MIPILLDLKIVKIYTFGVFLVLAFFWGMFWMWKNTKLTSYKEEEVFDIFFGSLVGVLFFSRLFHVILNFSDFGFDVMRFILINGYPGLSLIGALFGGFLSLFLFAKVRKMDFLHFIDYLAGPVMLSLAIGKLGSFFAGIDVGVKTNFILAVKYVGYQGLRHITPVYEALLYGVGAYFIHLILMSIRKEKLNKGFAFYFFIFYFSVTNLFLDKIKDNQLYFFGKSFNYIVSAILTIIFGIYFLYIFRKDIINYVGQTYKKFNERFKRETPPGGAELNQQN